MDKDKTDTGIAYRYVPGEGTPLVFIHGWLGSTESWSQVDDALDVQNPKLFYDQRCHGDSECTRFESFQELAADLERLIEELELDEPILIGHSMGGMAALTYATRTDNYTGMALFGSCASTPEPRIASPQFFLDKLAEMDRETWADMIAENYVPGDDHTELRKQAKQELLNADDDVLRHALAAMVIYDVSDQISAVTKPSLVIGGSNDAAITPRKSRELAELLGCELRMLDTTHLMLQEAPEQVVQELSRFLRNAF